MPEPLLYTDLGGASPAPWVPTSGQDSLRLSVWNSLATVTRVTVTGRMVTDEGRDTPFSYDLAVNSARTINTGLFPLQRGAILSLRVVTNGAPQRGETFARVEVVRGLSGGITPLAVLAQGYVQAAQPLAYPGSPIQSSLEGPGRLNVYTGNDPGAGAEIADAVPSGLRWRLLGVRATLVTDATVANRFPALTLDDTVVAYARWSIAAALVASGTNNLFWSNQGQNNAPAVGQISIPAAFPFLLPGGHVLRTSTNGLQAGDNWGAPQYIVEEWLEALS